MTYPATIPCASPTCTLQVPCPSPGEVVECQCGERIEGDGDAAGVADVDVDTLDTDATDITDEAEAAIEVGPFSVLRLRPTDLLLMFCDEELPPGRRTYSEDYWSRRLGGPVVLVDGGRRVGVIRREDGVEAKESVAQQCSQTGDKPEESVG